MTGLHPLSPATGQLAFRGDVYGAGWSETPTVLDVTIIPGQLAADAVIPNGTRFVAAQKRTATWAGTGGGTGLTTEIVYEVDVPRWL